MYLIHGSEQKAAQNRLQSFAAGSIWSMVNLL